MPAVQALKKIGAPFTQEEKVLKVRYDFSRDGGAIGTYDLFQASQECVITGFHAVVKAAVTSGGSATVELGSTGDTDRFVTAKAPAALTINTVLPEDGAFNQVLRLVAGDTISMTVATAALTAGVIEATIKVQKA